MATKKFGELNNVKNLRLFWLSQIFFVPLQQIKN